MGCGLALRVRVCTFPTIPPSTLCMPQNKPRTSHHGDGRRPGPGSGSRGARLKKEGGREKACECASSLTLSPQFTTGGKGPCRTGLVRRWGRESAPPPVRQKLLLSLL